MEFSDPLEFSNFCSFSPNGRLVASTTSHILNIREAEGLQLVKTYACKDIPNMMLWSPDSQLILCAMFKKSLVQVFSVSDPKWTCETELGAPGLSGAIWAPDSRHFITIAEFQLRLTIWSLIDSTSVVVKQPKFSSKGISFTPDGKFAAVLGRQGGKDSITILTCDSWTQVHAFEIPTHDASDLKWSPEGLVLCVWDSPLFYGVLLFGLDGRAIASYQAYDGMLGVKSVQWNSTGQLLAIGSYDERVRLLNHLTWKPFAEHTHPRVIKDKDIAIFVQKKSRYVIAEAPMSLPAVTVNPSKAYPKQGVGMIGWSGDSKYMFTRNDNMPTVVWVWDTKRLKLASILIHEQPVNHCQWDEMTQRLAIVCGNEHLFLWTPEGCSCVPIPKGPFHALRVHWNPESSSLLLLDRTQFRCCYFVDV